MPSTGEYVADLDASMVLKPATGSVPVNLTVVLVKPQEVCGDLADSWRSIRAANPNLASPYFDLEFTLSVARIRDDVEVAVFSDGDKVVGLLPFQRSSPKHAVPVGGRLNDSHGILMRTDNAQSYPTRALIEQMLKAAKLDDYAFHAMSQRNASLAEVEFCELGSHHLDLSDGWSAHHKWARKNSVAIKRQGQKTRKMGREVGPIRFEFDCRDSEVLESLIDMKRSKYQRTNTFDILSVDWASDLLREIAKIDLPGFKGILSALYAGDTLVAVHFGMLTDDILHYWFPVYDPSFHRYSPGTELLLKVAEESAQRGITKLDLGYGDDDYKFRFCNGHDVVSCGQVTFSPLAFQLAKQRYHLRQKLKGIPMKPLVKSVLRGLFPGFGQWNFK